jgi:hypothetical protein
MDLIRLFFKKFEIKTKRFVSEREKNKPIIEYKGENNEM